MCFFMGERVKYSNEDYNCEPTAQYTLISRLFKKVNFKSFSFKNLLFSR